MLFHTFTSQAERREFGDGDFLEFVFCKLSRNTPVEEIVSNEKVASLHWKNSSLYLCGDDRNKFCDSYGEIITDGTYANLKKGYLDWCGINWFSPKQASCIMNKIREEKPMDFEPLLSWLERETEFNGFYVLGL